MEHFKPLFTEYKEAEITTKEIKTVILKNIKAIIEEEWTHLTDCDFTLVFNKQLNKADIYKKTKLQLNGAISFTKSTIESWNESTTVKVNDVSIGELQVHKNRDNIKFRFILDKLFILLNADKAAGSIVDV